eukprot:1267113-Karenia_brevis.AAC.1
MDMPAVTLAPGGVLQKKAPEGPKVGDKTTCGLLGHLPKHALITNNAEHMRHKGELAQLRGSKTANDMVTHVREGRITATPGSTAPNRNISLFCEGN